jgi:hypothetical protein
MWEFALFLEKLDDFQVFSQFCYGFGTAEGAIPEG